MKQYADAMIRRGLTKAKQYQELYTFKYPQLNKLRKTLDMV